MMFRDIFFLGNNVFSFTCKCNDILDIACVV